MQILVTRISWPYGSIHPYRHGFVKLFFAGTKVNSSGILAIFKRAFKRSKFAGNTKSRHFFQLKRPYLPRFGR